MGGCIRDPRPKTSYASWDFGIEANSTEQLDQSNLIIFSRLHGLIQLYNNCFKAKTGLYRRPLNRLSPTGVQVDSQDSRSQSTFRMTDR